MRQAKDNIQPGRRLSQKITLLVFYPSNALIKSGALSAAGFPPLEKGFPSEKGPKGDLVVSGLVSFYEIPPSPL
jgi:hypothetical protein